MPSEFEKFLKSGHSEYNAWQEGQMPNLNTWLQRQRSMGNFEPSYPPINRSLLEEQMRKVNPNLHKWYTGWPYKVGTQILDLMVNPPILGSRLDDLIPYDFIEAKYKAFLDNLGNE